MAGNTLDINLSNPEQEAVLTASSLLKHGKIIVYPSDTVYGILANASNKEAVESVTRIKGYTNPRPYIVLVKDIDRAMELACLNKINNPTEARILLRKSCTVILPASAKAPKCSINNLGTIAIRIPQDPLSQKILHHSDLNLISTSANLKTEPFPLSDKQIPLQILSEASLFLNAGPLSNRTPSKIFDLTSNKPIQLR